MNFWASHLEETGEIDALRYVARRLDQNARCVVFDVGANAGDYARMCIDVFGSSCTVHAFEPSPDAFNELRQTALTESNIIAHQLALSDREGTATLFTPGGASTLASLHEINPLDQEAKRFRRKVRVTTLDAVCRNERIANVDLLKLDVEGHEFSALLGARGMLRKRRIRFIQYEFGENSIGARRYLRDFSDLLAADYNIFRVVPGGLVPWSYMGGVSEVFATMNYLCELKHSGCP